MKTPTSRQTISIADSALVSFMNKRIATTYGNKYGAISRYVSDLIRADMEAQGAQGAEVDVMMCALIKALEKKTAVNTPPEPDAPHLWLPKIKKAVLIVSYVDAEVMAHAYQVMASARATLGAERMVYVLSGLSDTEKHRLGETMLYGSIPVEFIEGSCITKLAKDILRASEGA
jgi:hypothetical protein